MVLNLTPRKEEIIREAWEEHGRILTYRMVDRKYASKDPADLLKELRDENLATRKRENGTTLPEGKIRLLALPEGMKDDEDRRTTASLSEFTGGGRC